MPEKKPSLSKNRKRSRAASRRNKGLSRAGIWITILGAAGLLAVLVLGLSQRPATTTAQADTLNVDLNAVADKSAAFESQGGDHIPEGTAHAAYNSNPPTSGPHYSTSARIGIYTSALADETVVHNLEHGHIWLSYRDAGDQEAINLLSDIQRMSPNWVIVTHRPQNTTRIAVASWTRLLTLDTLDSNQIQGFIVRYRNRAPESIPG